MDELERRARRRFSVALKCLLRFGKSPVIPAETKNISRTGLLVAYDAVKNFGVEHQGDCLQVFVEVPVAKGSRQGFLRCACAVVWRAVESGMVLLGLAVSKMSFEEVQPNTVKSLSSEPDKDVLM